MKRVLSGAVAVVLVVLSLRVWANEHRAAQERMTRWEIANHAVQDRMARQEPRPPFPVVPPPPGPGPGPWVAPTPFPWVLPVPNRGSAAFAPGSYDRILIPMDSAAIDPRFAVPVPDVDPRMVIAPRVTGLPAGSWPYGPRRR